MFGVGNVIFIFVFDVFYELFVYNCIVLFKVNFI